MQRLATIAIIGITVVIIYSVQPAVAQNANVCEQVTEIPKIECEALVALYNSTNGDEWKEKSCWLTTNTPCNWKGIKCKNGHIIELSLTSNQMSGNIPSELGNLASLTKLELTFNRLSGNIPSELGNLVRLKHLALGANQLSGGIPPELGNLTNLESLGLSFNPLGGSLPPELSNLTKLRTLYLGFNQLSGSLPPKIGNLTNLHYLQLAENQLSGSIPPELGNLVNLTDLCMDNNQLSGSIPPELGNLINLESLYMRDNCLNGSIPLKLENLSRLKRLDLSGNQLCIPPVISFQEWLAGIETVKGSRELCSISSLCEYQTEIPKTECEALVTLYISSDGEHWKNNTGWGQTITPCSWEHVTCHDGHVTKLSLSENQLKGSFSPALGDLLELTHLDLSSNQLGGSIPSELGKLINLTSLNLSENRLSGSIPPELSKLPQLTHLVLSGNQFSGNLPPALGDLLELTHLDLSNNQFSGRIPTELGKLVRLKCLDLHGNQLSGRIPPELGTLTNLEYLNLSDNQLCEPTDTSFRRWVNGLEFYDNTCKICYEDLYDWVLVLTVILGSSLLISGIMMGVYASLKQIYGTSYDYLFGYSRNETNALKITGVLNRVILTGGLFGILGGLCGLTVVSYEKIGDSLILLGILLGVATGVLYSLFSRKEKIYNRAAIYEKIYGDDIFNYIKKALRTGSSPLVAGLFTGMTVGAITAGLFGEMTHGAAGTLAGAMTGVVVGGVAGFFGGLASTMTGWFPGGIVGGIAGGTAGHLAYYRLSHLAGFTLVKDSGLSEGIGMGIAGALSGIIVGYVVGLIISLIAVVLTRIILFIMMMVNKLVSSALIPSLIISRFKTIICGSCLRYTEPLKSWYEDGIRHCEHCHERVEYTPDLGVVRLIFGNASPAKSDGRIFALSNPDFEQKDQAIDVSEVYIDPKTCDLRLFERFITYIINHPPKYGLQSVQIFYRGELDDLGQNLKNTLQNNFEYVKGLH